MGSLPSISTALCLTTSDIDALNQGRMIAALSRTFINSVQCFALCPVDLSDSGSVLLQAWAKLEFCKIYNNPHDLEKLSKLTIWSNEFLQNTVTERHKIFLAGLRVYRVPQPIEISSDRVNSSKIGSFIKLPNPLPSIDSSPVLTDSVFQKRLKQLINLEPPQHSELEELQNTFDLLSQKNPVAAEINQDIKVFLGWDTGRSSIRYDSDLDWIKTIAEIGNSSDGHEFEKLVRRGLIKLGFTGSNLNPGSTGGAGGMDFYCENPYPIVGECKATKTETVSDGTPAQLLKIGLNHLGKEQYERSIKLIIAAGDLNFYASRTARENEMNVIRPETFQNLIEIQTLYRGSVNLIELKNCLQQAPFGVVDEKLNNYIDKVRQDIRTRSHIIEAIKQLGETEPGRTQFEVTEIRVQYNAGFAKLNGKNLDNQTVYELLIELSSPLTGYLGRITAGGINSDRFYFLRDLPINFTLE